ncbi:hypothetical protein LOD99_13582 [Oopsacas minuta]|uniref:Uncharacterized protein n=1 Tax=Oopsacas minuta TaxID=111878 RepID=A0AAV7KI29_9METZ|nr:hypothetical protein LOD99_13582 [Oopsacas minuta]
MSMKPRVICHKERKSSNDTEKIVQNEQFISANEFMKEFSFSIDSEESKRFTNNFVDFPTISEFKSPGSPNFSTTLLTTASLQDLTSKSDTQLQNTISENFNSLQLLKYKQQSLTDVTSDIKSVQKTQKKKTNPKPRCPDFSTSRRDRKPDTTSKLQTHSKDRLAPPTSELKLKTRTAHKSSISTPDDTQQITFDSSRILTSQHTRPPSVEVTLLGRPQAPAVPPGISLELQNSLLLSAIHLNLSAQRSYSESEKEAINQLSKLHKYKQKLLHENFELKSEEKRLEINCMTNFALGELGTVEEVLTRLKLAGAQIVKLSEAMSRAQSSVKLQNIYLSDRDREKCEKYLRELSSVATRSLTTIRSLLSQVYDVCDKVQIITKEREEDLNKLREASEELDRYAGMMLSRISLQSHVRLLEENLDIIREPEKLYMVYPDEL